MSAVLTSDMRPSDAGHHQFEGAAFYMPEDPEWTKALDRYAGIFIISRAMPGWPLRRKAGNRYCSWHGTSRTFASATYSTGNSKRTCRPSGALRCSSRLYGYSGPLAVVADASDFMRWNEHAAGLLKAALVRRGIVAAFIRLHPLRPAALGALERHGSLGAPRATVVVDLTRPIDQLWRETRKGHRSAIRALQRRNYNAHMDEDFLHLQRFRTLYEDTMQRNGADAQYYFNSNYYEAFVIVLIWTIEALFC